MKWAGLGSSMTTHYNVINITRFEIVENRLCWLTSLDCYFNRSVY
ncbi:hypothetical protein GCM10009647_089250 [Streptomyces sanglieri]